MKDIYQYFVEGEDEKHLIEVLKTDMKLIMPGKVQIFNVVQEIIKDSRLKILSNNTTLVFLFDTDVENTNILYPNIQKAEKSSKVKKVLCVTQVKNLEDELIRCTNISNIEELLNSKSKSDFKRDFLKERHVQKKLENHGFDIEKLWCQTPPKPFDEISNDAKVIKISNQC